MLVVQNVVFEITVDTDALHPFGSGLAVHHNTGLLAVAVGLDLFSFTTIADTDFVMTLGLIDTDIIAGTGLEDRTDKGAL